jgi:hypothetical protein
MTRPVPENERNVRAGARGGGGDGRKADGRARRACLPGPRATRLRAG